jgi:hypothetical protein
MSGQGDVVLIYHQDRPAAFARIESIEPDIKRGWYHVTLLLLTIPTQTVTWILKDAYINGDPFTMGGKNMRFDEVKKPPASSEKEAAADNSRNSLQGKRGKVIPFKKD